MISAFMREVENVGVSRSRTANIDLGTKGRIPWGRIVKSKAGRGSSRKRDPDQGNNTGNALEM